MYSSSVAPDITEGLPATIGSSLLTDYPPTAGWDVSFGENGFTLRPSKSQPYQRATEPSKKQQIDTSESAGEQTLSNWWVRSQDSWDMGAGVRYYEPGARSYEGFRDRETLRRFSDSFGVDPWKQGELTLLHKTNALTPQRAAESHLSNLTVGATEGYVEAFGTTAIWNPLPSGTPVTVTLGGASATQPAAAGGLVWIGHVNGLTRFIPGTAVDTPIIWTDGTGGRVWWAKARLIVAVGPILYELPAPPLGAAVFDIATLGKVIFTHPSSGWVWSDVTESSGAILASGYTTSDSAIFRFALEQDSLGQPILSSGSQVGRMPPGEHITAMQIYLGNTVVLGTSSGVRVGTVNAAGDVLYGPLTIETASPVRDISFASRFAYVAVSGAQEGGVSGAARVDLSSPIADTGRFAYAWDVPTAATGTALSIAVVSDRVFLTVDRVVYGQSVTEYVSRGWLDTGRIRFGTIEPKAFRYVRTVVATNGGTAEVVAVASDDSEHRVIDLTDGYNTDSDTAITIPGRTLNGHLSFKVYLTPGVGNTTPTLNALSVKAVPAPTKVRLYQFPLSCYDYEMDRSGNRHGVEGGAYLRLSALESLEESGRPVPIIDNRTGEKFTGQIDTIEFTATNPPSTSLANFGGVAVVTVRRL
jgi:hypothetical protein